MLSTILQSLAQIATIALVGGVFFAWRNVQTLSIDSSLRLNRAAKEKAIEAAAMYLNNHVAQFDEIFKRAGNNEFARYEGNIGDFSPQSLDNKGLASAQQKLSISGIHVLFNTLELISAYFVTGVTDEKEGFRIIGRSFCDTVQRDYDFIAACRSYPGHPFWFNIVSLYKIWSPHLKGTEIQSTVEHLEGIVSRLKSKSSSQ